MSMRTGRLLLLLVAGLVMLLTALGLINTSFMLYDDEGYVLLTYRNFIAGGRLYDDIFSQYGPWPYVYHLLIHWIASTPLTHHLGRIITAIHWSLTALLLGAITFRLSEKKWLALSVAIACFGLLWPISNEPSHPGSLICCLLALTSLLILHAHANHRWPALAVTLGVGTALLVLTKINIGILFLSGAGLVALRLTNWPPRWQPVTTATAIAGLLLIPWGLMGSNLDKPWVLNLAIQFTLSATGLLWLIPTTTPQRSIPPANWLTAALYFGLTVLTVIVVVCLRGTTLSAIVQTVLVNPLRQPACFIMGFTWQPWIWPLAILCTTLTALAGWEWRRRARRLPFYIQAAIVALRTATLGWFVLHLKIWLTLSSINTVMGACLPLIPIFLIPLTRQAVEQNALRLWITALSLPQILHAYPVAGSQMAWGTFLLIPLLFSGWHDAAIFLADQWSPTRGRLLLKCFPTLLVSVGLLQIGTLMHTGWTRYHTSRPFGLPGAENIRAGDHARLMLRTLTLNAAIHADILFSRQGMFSYNLWSGVPTPTAQNATHWFWLLDAPAQQAIIDRLHTTPHSAIIVSRELDAFLTRIGVPMDCPLQTFITGNYSPLFSIGGFDFLMPIGSPAVPFGRIDRFASAAPDPTRAILWQTNLALDGQLTSLRLQAITYPWTVHTRFTPSDAHITLQPINRAGENLGPEISLPHPRPLRGLYRLNLYCDHEPLMTNPRDFELVGISVDGQTVFEAVF